MKVKLQAGTGWPKMATEFLGEEKIGDTSGFGSWGIASFESSSTDPYLMPTLYQKHHESFKEA